MVEILELFRRNGFFLDRESLIVLSGGNEEEILRIIKKLVERGVKERVITKRILESSECLSRGCKNCGINLLSVSEFLSRKVEVGDFVRHFKSRYEILGAVLRERGENLSSVRRIGGEGGVYNIIVMISGKKITKNKNLLVEVEDSTGRTVVLVNKEKIDLFKRVNNLMLDDVVMFKVSGSSDMLFANDVVLPDIGLEKEKFGDADEFIAFSGDFHAGSKNFLEENVLKFVNWLNGEVGDERQRDIALKIKYLVLVGDMVDGVGIYSGQENWLDIKNIRGQYKKVAEILGRIRKDVEIVMCAGQHDAVWVGEPQRPVLKKWAKELYEMKNLKIVANPSLVEVGGFRILMYHGASINRFIDEIDDIRVGFGHRFPTKIVKEMLKRRHLAPTHGLVDYIPGEVDSMVIDVVPDIVATGDQHRAEIDCYNNILMIAGSCWQSITPFEEKIGNVPEPCRVPLFNLKTREIKIVDFIDDKIKWEESNDLVCELEVGDNA